MPTSRPLLGRDGAFVWRQGDFNMTSDREHFVARTGAEAQGYRRCDDAVWRRPGHDDLLPLYQGAMVYDLHPNTGAHVRGTGHGTAWERPLAIDDLRPAWLVAAGPWRSSALQRARARIVLRALSNATNERTAVACLLPDVPCGNSLGVFEPRLHLDAPLRAIAAGAALLSSLAFDWAVRLRLGGTNLNGFVLADCVLPRLDDATEAELATLALRLCAVLPWHGPLWQQAIDEGWLGPREPAVEPQQATRAGHADRSAHGARVRSRGRRRRVDRARLRTALDARAPQRAGWPRQGLLARRARAAARAAPALPLARCARQPAQSTTDRCRSRSPGSRSRCARRPARVPVCPAVYGRRSRSHPGSGSASALR
jgi:hypothetical protein